MKLKRQSSVVCLALLLAFIPRHAQAAMLPKKQIAADAKWLLHVELDDFRASQVGGFVEKRFVTENLAELAKNLKFDVGALLKKVSSVTAYGVDYGRGARDDLASGVLLIRADAEAQKVLEGFLAAQMLANTNSPVKQLQTEPYPLYSVAKDIFAAVHPNHTFIVGKSRGQIDKARAVLLGEGPNLTSSTALADFPTAPDSFFCIAVAEGFSEHAGLPTQAKVLQMTDGARVALGEKADRLFLTLDLKAKTTEVVTQIQQVLQGVLALFSLGEIKDQDVVELVQAIKVSAKDKVVSIGVDYPVAKAITKLEEQAAGAEKTANRPNKGTKKQPKARQSTSTAEPEAPEKNSKPTE